MNSAENKNIHLILNFRSVLIYRLQENYQNKCNILQNSFSNGTCLNASVVLSDVLHYIHYIANINHTPMLVLIAFFGTRLE